MKYELWGVVLIMWGTYGMKCNLTSPTHKQQ